VIQAITDRTGKELASLAIKEEFDRTYLDGNGPVRYEDHNLTHSHGHSDAEKIDASLRINDQPVSVSGAGNGPLDALMKALRDGLGIDAHVMSYVEHAISIGEDSKAVAYVQLRFGWDQSAFGVGVHPNIVTAALKSILSAVNRGVALGYVQVAAPAATKKVANLK
jgi:2-isopropylmalate synthase